MNKCWKFQADISIRFWFRAKWLKICCNQWTHVGQMDSCWTTWVHWLQQIFSHLALNQKRIEISAWNFQRLFITCLRKFEKKILAIAQSACQPRPISAKTLDASSDHICWDILKRKKLVRFWTYWSNLLKGFFNISKKMAFLIFLKSLWVHPHDVHGLLCPIYHPIFRRKKLIHLIRLYPASLPLPRDSCKISSAQICIAQWHFVLVP